MKLRYGYLFVGITLGLLLFSIFIMTLPDGKLHLTVCDVGQGDSVYLRMPDGRDMLVDGGPDTKKVLLCLGRHMPFYDRTIDVVVLTHPHSDHLTGLSEVLKRFFVGRIIKTGIDGEGAEYASFMHSIQAKKIPLDVVTRGDTIHIGSVALETVWPTESFIHELENIGGYGATTDVPVVANDRFNETSLVFHLRFGSFDALLTGDADTLVENMYGSGAFSQDAMEFLKVPHHGSQTSLLDAFIHALHPKIAAISVGKNSFGHPSEKTIKQLEKELTTVYRTDTSGDITIVSDGVSYSVVRQK